ncbi:MAG: MarR family transcriptional regulator [Chitinophagaceae bacterium]|jgi:DNA-binding MarR family transcriptional regulator|nr:MarR family transcriptional regulator [Chitinophagaceae bacterium]
MKKESIFKLDNEVCFPLYALSRGITNAYRPFLEALGVTYPQYLALTVLWEKDGLTVNQIGEKLHLDSGTLTPLLKRLEAKKILVRKRKEEDERVVIITLTASGAAMKKKAVKIPQQVVAALGLTENELKQLKNFTGKILKKCSKEDSACV